MKYLIYSVFSFIAICLCCSCGQTNGNSSAAEVDSDSLAAANSDFGESVWHFDYYVDEFGESTNEGFVKGVSTNGDFSNSATEHSELTVNVLVDSDAVRLQLYEYSGDNPIKDQGILDLKVKDDKNEISNFSFYVSSDGYCGIDDTFAEKTAKDFINLLKNNKNLRCAGETNQYGNVSTYRFEIPTLGFKSQFAKFKK